jgi:hypothetical protein
METTTSEITLSRRELQTLLYVGRKLELIACYVPIETAILLLTIGCYKGERIWNEYANTDAGWKRVHMP